MQESFLFVSVLCFNGAKVMVISYRTKFLCFLFLFC